MDSEAKFSPVAALLANNYARLDAIAASDALRELKLTLRQAALLELALLSRPSWDTTPSEANTAEMRALLQPAAEEIASSSATASNAYSAATDSSASNANPEKASAESANAILDRWMSRIAHCGRPINEKSRLYVALVQQRFVAAAD